MPRLVSPIAISQHSQLSGHPHLLVQKLQRPGRPLSVGPRSSGLRGPFLKLSLCFHSHSPAVGSAFGSSCLLCLLRAPPHFHSDPLKVLPLFSQLSTRGSHRGNAFLSPFPLENRSGGRKNIWFSQSLASQGAVDQRTCSGNQHGPSPG